MHTKLCIPEKVLDQHVAWLGKTGAGKSSAMRHVVEHLLDHNKRVCVVDPKGDWSGLKTSADGSGPGYPVIGFGDFKNPKATDVPINEHSGKHIAELIAGGNRPCIIGLRGWTQGAMTRFWIDFASTLFNSNAGELYLVIDEVHNFAPKGKILSPEAGNCLHWSNRLLSEARGYGLVCLIASQRPQKVHNDTLTCCETLVAMRVVHKADRQAVKEWIEGCGDMERGKEVLNDLAGMDRGEAYVWSPEIKFGPQRLKFPMFQTFDSFAAPQLQKKVSASGWSAVNLDEVKVKLADVIKEADDNDPKKLKARIAQLEKAARTVQAPAQAKEVTKEIQVVSDRDMTIIETAVSHVRDMAREINERVVEMTHCSDALDEIAGRLRDIKKPIPSIPGRLHTFTPAKLHKAIRQVEGRDDALRVSNGEPGKGARQVLIAIAQNPEGATDQQIAVLTGYKKTSRVTFKQELKAHGFMVAGGRGYVATPFGIQWLGTDYEPLPTGNELRAHWLTRLTGGPLALFKQYVEAYPNPVANDDMMEFTGYRKTSVVTFRQELVARNLVVGHAASPDLFD